MLTIKSIEALKADTSQYEVSDGEIRGLRLRVSPKGTKSFYLLYRFRERRQRTKLGRYPDLGLADARSRARKILGLIEEGVDPRSVRDQESGSLKSVEALAAEFFEKHVRVRNKERTQYETIRIVTNDIVGPWRLRDVRDITDLDAQDLIDEIIDTRSPHAGALAFKAGRTFFNWLRKRKVIKHSPFQDIENPVGNSKRDRVLENAEIKAVWLASFEMGYPWGQMVRMLFLSAARRNEVAGARWEEIKDKDDVWELPPERTKGGRGSAKPLTDLLRDELKSISGDRSGLLFPSMREGSENSVSGFSKMKKRLDTLSGVREWRVHDIRRTVATRLGGHSVPDTLIARILDHNLVGVPDVTGTYNKYRYVPQMRKALELWHAELRTIIEAPDITEDTFSF